MATTSMNPEDKKKKTEADKPEEQRNNETKKRQNKKSQTDKDEKNRTKQQPDAKKNVADDGAAETKELNRSFAENFSQLQLMLSDWKEGKNKPSQNTDMLEIQKTVNASLKEISNRIASLGKKKRESKQEKSEKKYKKLGAAISTGLTAGAKAFDGYAKGNRLL